MKINKNLIQIVIILGNNKKIRKIRKIKIIIVNGNII